MIIFIDESGDSGLDIKKGASPYLVFSMVIFNQEKYVSEISNKILGYKKKIRYSTSYEFKFRKTNKKILIGLLKSVKLCNFKIISLVVDKKDLKFERKLSNKQVYTYLLSLLLNKYLSKKLNVKIRLDGHAEREFQRSMKSFVRKYLGKVNKEIKVDFKIIDSKNDILIQLADVVVGSIARSYMVNKKDSAIYRKIIEKHIKKEWVLENGDLEPILK